MVFLQETWHRQAMEYTTRGWRCISSGVGDTTKRAQAGVMTLLRASVFPQDHIRFHAHVDGRVLQVKAFCKGGWIETINVYQHVMMGHHQRDSDLMQKRAHVWKTLRTIIGQIPHGSKMVVAGDLNCNMETVRDCTGTGMVVSEEASPDREDLAAILQDLQLRAINTYGRRGSYTYIHEGYKPARRSFIDFILVRQQGLGQYKSGLIKDWSVARWRQGGRHLPTWATLAVRRCRTTLPATVQPWPNWRCKLLAQAARDNPHLVEQFRQQVEQRLRTEGEYEPRRLNQLLLQVGSEVFPGRRPAAVKPPWEEAGYVGQIRKMWDHYRRMKQAILDSTSRRSFLRSVIELETQSRFSETS